MDKLKFLTIFLFLVFITSYELRVTSYELFAQDKIVAIVNNDIITEKDLNDFLNFMRMQLSGQFKGEQLENKIQSMKLDLLNRLIEDRLILQEAKKSNLKIDDNRIKAKLEETKKRYPTESEFQDALAKQGLVQADIEAKIREQFLIYNIIDRKIRSKIMVNPAEVTNFYEKNREEFKISEQREFESIAVTDGIIADEIYDRLEKEKDKDFTEIASEYALKVNKFTVREGKELKPEIEEIVFRLIPEESSEPIKINDSYYIFKLNNILPARQQSLSEVQEEIHTFIFQQKMQEELTKWLNELKKHAYIKIIQG
jgi:parvulin-like peptidyl-prolyl isomerase